MSYKQRIQDRQIQRGSGGNHSPKTDADDNKLCETLQQFYKGLTEESKNQQELIQKAKSIYDEALQCLQRVKASDDSNSDSNSNSNSDSKGTSGGHHGGYGNVDMATNQVHAHYKRDLRATLEVLFSCMGLSMSSLARYGPKPKNEPNPDGSPSTPAQRIAYAVLHCGPKWDGVRDCVVDMAVLCHNMPEVIQHHASSPGLGSSDPAAGPDPYKMRRQELINAARQQLCRILSPAQGFTAQTMYDHLRQICETILLPPYVHRILYQFVVACRVDPQTRTESPTIHRAYDLLYSDPGLRETMRVTCMLRNYVSVVMPDALGMSQDEQEQTVRRCNQTICRVFAQPTSSESEIARAIQSVYRCYVETLQRAGTSWRDVTRKLSGADPDESSRRPAQQPGALIGGRAGEASLEDTSALYSEVVELHQELFGHADDAQTAGGEHHYKEDVSPDDSDDDDDDADDRVAGGSHDHDHGHGRHHHHHHHHHPHPHPHPHAHTHTQRKLHRRPHQKSSPPPVVSHAHARPAHAARSPSGGSKTTNDSLYASGGTSVRLPTE